MSSSDPEESAPFRSIEPLVPIRDVEIRAKLGDVDRDLSKSMSAINEHEDIVAVAKGSELLHWQHDGRCASDVAEACDSNSGITLQNLLHRTHHVLCGAGYLDVHLKTGLTSVMIMYIIDGVLDHL